MRRAEKQIAQYQNELAARHAEEVRTIYATMRAWRHDYHNHIQTMTALLSFGQYDRLSEYLARLNDDLTNVDTVLKTGNVMLDAILNAKLALCKARQIPVDATAIVPPALRVSDVDLCVLLGNLLDNAIEANDALPPETRAIRVYIAPMKSHLYLSVQNAAPAPLRRGPAFLSRKRPAAPGLGLSRIDAIARKYQGRVNRQYEPGVFATEVLLPM